MLKTMRTCIIVVCTGCVVKSKTTKYMAPVAARRSNGKRTAWGSWGAACAWGACMVWFVI